MQKLFSAEKNRSCFSVSLSTALGLSNNLRYTALYPLKGEERITKAVVPKSAPKTPLPK